MAKEKSNYDAELAVFKKKLKQLASYKGRHTELITLYIPHGTDRSTVMNQLSEEINQSSNIKSPTTRKNVQGALRKIIVFLKKINFKLPKNGIVIFSGNISEVEGRSNIKILTVYPLKDLNTKLYWCDSEFHLDPLREMVVPNEFYALMTIDKNEATIAQLSGKKYEVIGHFTSTVPGKTRAGGQSSQRFERLREEAMQDFFKRVGEKFNGYFASNLEKVTGVIIGGPGMTKQYFIDKQAIHHELGKKVIGVVDTSYTDEGGIRELVQKSETLLKDTEMMREKVTLDNFLGEVAKDALATYGAKEVEKAMEDGKVKQLIISEEIPWIVIKKLCGHCEKEEFETFKNPGDYDEAKVSCSECKSKVEVMEEVDYLDYMIEKANETGAEVRVVGTETAQGKNFLEGFGGVGAILRY
jgi:peptide chain release factor subunit 1